MNVVIVITSFMAIGFVLGVIARHYFKREPFAILVDTDQIPAKEEQLENIGRKLGASVVIPFSGKDAQQLGVDPSKAIITIK